MFIMLTGHNDAKKYILRVSDIQKVASYHDYSLVYSFSGECFMVEEDADMIFKILRCSEGE